MTIQETTQGVAGPRVIAGRPALLTDRSTHYCPGCGHGVVHRLIAELLGDLGLGERTIAVAPVGCAVFAYDYIDVDWIEAPHGRAPAVATGIRRVRPGAFVNLRVQTVRRGLLVGDEHEEWRRHAVTRRRVLHRFDDLGLVELLAGKARHASALLHEAQQRGFMEEAGDFDEVVHEVAVQTGCRGEQHVVAAAGCELADRQALAAAAVPIGLLDELEEVMVERRQASRRLGLERNGAAALARLIAELHHERSRRQLPAYHLERDAAAAARPRRHQPDLRPHVGEGQHRQRSQARGPIGVSREPWCQQRAKPGIQAVHGIEPSRRQRVEQKRAPVVEDVQQAKKRARIRRSEVRHVGLTNREAQHDEVLEVVVGNAEHLGRDDEPRPDGPGQ